MLCECSFAVPWQTVAVSLGLSCLSASHSGTLRDTDCSDPIGETCYLTGEGVIVHAAVLEKYRKAVFGFRGRVCASYQVLIVWSVSRALKLLEMKFQNRKCLSKLWLSWSGYRYNVSGSSVRSLQPEFSFCFISFFNNDFLIWEGHKQWQGLREMALFSATAGSWR